MGRLPQGGVPVYRAGNTSGPGAREGRGRPALGGAP